MKPGNDEKREIIGLEGSDTPPSVTHGKRKRHGNTGVSKGTDLPAVIDNKSRDSLYTKSMTYYAEAEAKSGVIRNKIALSLAQPVPVYIDEIVKRTIDEQADPRKAGLVTATDAVKSKDFFDRLFDLYTKGLEHKGEKIDGGVFLEPLAFQIARLLTKDISPEDKLEIFIRIRAAFEASIAGDDDLFRDICFVFERLDLGPMLYEYFDSLHYTQLDSAIPQEVDNLMLALEGKTLYFHCENSLEVEGMKVENISTRLSAMRVFERAIDLYRTFGENAATGYLELFTRIPKEKSAVPVRMADLLHALETDDKDEFANTLLYAAYDLVIEERPADERPVLAAVDVKTETYRRMVLEARVELLRIAEKPDLPAFTPDPRKNFLKKYATPVFGLWAVNGDRLGSDLKKSPALLTRIHDLSNLVFIGLSEPFMIDYSQKTTGLLFINSTIELTYRFSYNGENYDFRVSLGRRSLLHDDFLYVFTAIRDKCGTFAGEAMGGLRTLLDSADKHLLDESGFWKDIVERHFIDTVVAIPEKCGSYASEAYESLRVLIKGVAKKLLEDDRFWQVVVAIPGKCGFYTAITCTHLQALLLIVDETTLDDDRFWKNIVEGHFLDVLAAISHTCGNLTYIGYELFQILIGRVGKKSLDEDGFWISFVKGHFLDSLVAISERFRSYTSSAYETFRVLLASADKDLLETERFWKDIVEGHFLETVISISDKCGNNEGDAYESLRTLLTGADNKLLAEDRFWRIVANIPEMYGNFSGEVFKVFLTLLGRSGANPADDPLLWEKIVEDHFLDVATEIFGRCGANTHVACDRLRTLLEVADINLINGEGFWKSIEIDENGEVRSEQGTI